MNRIGEKLWKIFRRKRNDARAARKIAQLLQGQVSDINTTIHYPGTEKREEEACYK